MNSRPIKYMLQLDALRALAVLAVIVEHWPSGENILVSLNLGFLGVSFFFVLSGFLISQILLRNKDKIIAKETSIGRVIKQFVVRRALRIFPIYYLTIFVFYFLDLSGIRDKFAWYFFYGSNFYLFKIMEWDGPLTHFWTLAIEEQFYLFWPLLIMLVPSRHLSKLFLFFLLMPPIFRLVMGYIVQSQQGEVIFVELLTFSCIDSFGIGALLALHRTGGFKINLKWLKIFRNFDWFILLYVFFVLYFPRESLINILLLSVFANLFAVTVISKASNGYENRWIKSILENQILLFLGKISYGIYLYHNIIPYFYSVMINQAKKLSIELPVLDNDLLRYTVYFVILIVVSAISWYVIEKPINSAKKYFNY
ncbi:MAG: acyltransferase [Cyclobacteriaceae bacterium]|nr:acyltransferase [Cyclobacteriaceae bacterium]